MRATKHASKKREYESGLLHNTEMTACFSFLVRTYNVRIYVSMLNDL
jgi:hypothetical protein